MRKPNSIWWIPTTDTARGELTNFGRCQSLPPNAYESLGSVEFVPKTEVARVLKILSKYVEIPEEALKEIEK